MGAVLSSKRGLQADTQRLYPPDYSVRRPSPSKLLVNGAVLGNSIHPDGHHLPYEIALLIHRYFGDCNIIFDPSDHTKSHIQNGGRTYQLTATRWEDSLSSLHAPYLSTRSLSPHFAQGFHRGVHYLSVFFLHRGKCVEKGWDGHKCSLCKSSTTFIGVQSVPSRYHGLYIDQDALQWSVGQIVTVVLNVNAKDVKWYNGTTLKYRMRLREVTRDYRDCSVLRNKYRFKMRIHPQNAIFEIVPTPQSLLEGQVLRL